MAGIWVPWLVDAARLTGYPASEVTGWRSRGHDGLSAVEGVVLHHTAGPKTGEYPSLGVVRDGRADLPGPLANFGIGRSGTVYVVAAGVAWHAGESAWAGFSSLNSRFLGIEAEDDGDGVWTAEQVDCYPRLVAACLYYMRRDASRAAAHREVALPAGRKVDPTGIDMDKLRARVAQLLLDPLRLIPRNPAAQQEEPMTPEDRAYFDKRFTDLWSLWNVRKDDRGVWRDRLTDLWDELRATHDDVDALHAPGGATTLSDADVQRIAAAVIGLLGRKTSAQ